MQFLKKILVKILILESRLILLRYKPFIIAVTGSVGKTSTKDAIYAVVKDKSRLVRKSEKSLNSEIGLPLTIIGAPNAWKSVRGWLRNIGAGAKLILRREEYPDCLVLEVGADHPGDIRRVAKWLRPHIAVLTRVSRTPVHVEFFHSPEQVHEEKINLVKNVRRGGLAIINGEDERSVALKDMLAEKKIKVVTYGNDARLDVVGQNFVFSYERALGGTSGGESIKLDLNSRFDVKVKGETLDRISGNVHGKSSDLTGTIIYKNPVGRVAMYPYLAAIAVGLGRGIRLEEIIRSFQAFKAPKGRMNLLEGIKNSVIIDDSYNSSPDAVEAALETLRELTCAGRKIAFLGDMMELGKYSAEEHRKMGILAAKSADILVTVGQRSRVAALSARANGMKSEMVHEFDASQEAAEFAVKLVSENDLVLVKGSQSMRMERITKELLKHYEKAEDLIVRQEKEWLEKI